MGIFSDSRRSDLRWSAGCSPRVLCVFSFHQTFGVDRLVFFQLSVLTGVRFLQTSLENVLKHGDPNSESDGWLLENSFMETARINLNIIKNLGKCNQIDVANNGDPNINVPCSSKAHYGPDNVPRKHTADAS